MIQRDNRHWQTEDYKQRMTINDWRGLVLAGMDHVVYKGNVYKLVAKIIAPNVVEVYKDLNNDTSKA